MNMEECYHRLGGDYSQVLLRIPSGALVKKFLIKFLADGSFAELSGAMEREDRDTAFRASHTLKGVCANLGLEQLRASASELTEVLRAAEAIPAEAAGLMERVQEDYRHTVGVIRDFEASEQ